MKPILNIKPYTIVRTTAPNPVAGRVVQGVESNVPITANVQPVSLRQLMALPEARRSEKVKRFFTSTRIYVAGELVSGTQYNADQIVIAGERYEVWQVDEWADDHFECWASRGVTP